ncbi:hypothetical protein OUZ56_020673 [Daphnia magna]|uniref:Uncharacterized protein n=1 Tax=Daphnia magna TaxID=35525 RepID=A0ABQ9ZF44_9CRUS|nr:hypothetical protein OUZ56_020673 [Daphnia magna]
MIMFCWPHVISARMRSSHNRVLAAVVRGMVVDGLAYTCPGKTPGLIYVAVKEFLLANDGNGRSKRDGRRLLR